MNKVKKRKYDLGTKLSALKVKLAVMANAKMKILQYYEIGDTKTTAINLNWKSLALQCSIVHSRCKDGCWLVAWV